MFSSKDNSTLKMGSVSKKGEFTKKIVLIFYDHGFCEKPKGSVSINIHRKVLQSKHFLLSIPCILNCIFT